MRETQTENVKKRVPTASLRDSQHIRREQLGGNPEWPGFPSRGLHNTLSHFMPQNLPGGPDLRVGTILSDNRMRHAMNL